MTFSFHNAPICTDNFIPKSPFQLDMACQRNDKALVPASMDIWLVVWYIKSPPKQIMKIYTWIDNFIDGTIFLSVNRQTIIGPPIPELPIGGPVSVVVNLLVYHIALVWCTYEKRHVIRYLSVFAKRKYWDQSMHPFCLIRVFPCRISHLYRII